MSRNFDFIIVGGGSSGSLLATRLSKKGATLLIERGVNTTTFPQHGVRQGWPQIESLAAKSFQASSGHWTGSANIFGGSSAINSGACWRGQQSLFTQLGFDEVKVDESFQDIESRLCGQTSSSTDFNQLLKTSWSEAGFVTNATTPTGRVDSSSSSLQQQQVSVHEARTLFVDGEQQRLTAGSLVNNEMIENKNLTVLLLTKAQKINFDGDLKAQSVNVENPVFGNVTLWLRRGGKVYLAAGAFETPKLLMLSGIGPRNTLEQHGIDVLVDNPAVGQNVVDRKVLNIGIPLLNPINGSDVALHDYAAVSNDAWVTVSHRQTSPWGFGASAIFSRPQDRTPECVQRLLDGLGLFGTGAVSPEFQQLPIWRLAARRPNVRGVVSLGSDSYLDPPVFNDGWNWDNLSPEAELDLDILVNATQKLIIDVVTNTMLVERLGHAPSGRTGIFATNTIEALLALAEGGGSTDGTCTLNQDLFTPCVSWNQCVPTVPPLSSNSRDNLRQTIKNLLTSSMDVSGSARVGQVVDPQTLSVKGVNNLVIADLSVVGEPVDIDPMLSAMAIGDLVGRQATEVPTPSIEYVPIVISFIFLGGTILFSAYVLATICFFSKKKNNATTIKSSYFYKDDDDNNNNQLEDDTQDQQNNGNYTNGIEVNGNALLSWSNLGCLYAGKRGKEDKITLSGASGQLRETELAAIMGPSGGGKSTLLDILSQRKTLGHLSGKMSILGTNVDDIGTNKHKLLRKYSAYIPQQEVFFPTQTAEEAVAFMANMCLGKDNTESRDQLIRTLLDQVGLSPEVTGRSIGGTLAGGVTIRGLSGGERKRLALACALALDPKILFIDELTSGLDSENAYSTMKLLKTLCVRNKVAALVVIHQPNADVFELFDRLVLLSKGRCIFSDKTSELNAFYNDRLSQPFPDRHDLPIDLLRQAKAFDKNNNNNDGALVVAMQKNDESSSALIPTVKSNKSRAPVSAFRKFQLVFWRNALNQYVRNPTNLLARLVIYAMVPFFAGILFYQVAASDELERERLSIVVGAFTYAILTPYLLPFSTISIFAEEKRFFTIESGMGLYSPWAYCISQALLELWVTVMTLMFATILQVYLVGMINPVLPDWISFFYVFSIQVVSGMVGGANVLFFTITSPSQDLAFLNCAGFVTIGLGLSGGFVPVSEIPLFIRWLQWISPCKYSIQGLSINRFGGTGLEFLLRQLELDRPDTIGANLGALFAFFFVFGIGSIVGLARQREVR